MNMRDLLHKRVLVAVRENGYRSTNSTVSELLIMEVSPSGNFVKVRDVDGRRYWKSHADIVPVEVLACVEKAPQDNVE
jgi:hypothetical protein